MGTNSTDKFKENLGIFGGFTEICQQLTTCADTFASQGREGGDDAQLGREVRERRPLHAGPRGPEAARVGPQDRDPRLRRGQHVPRHPGPRARPLTAFWLPIRIRVGAVRAVRARG